MKKMHMAESSLNRLLNFMDEIDAPSVEQVDAMAAIMETQDQMRGMLAEMKAKPRIKSVRMERIGGLASRAIPEYEDPLVTDPAAQGASIDAALAAPTPTMPAADGVEGAIVAKGLGLAPSH